MVIYDFLMTANSDQAVPRKLVKDFLREYCGIENPTTPYKENVTDMLMESPFLQQVLQHCYRTVTSNPEKFGVEVTTISDTNGNVINSIINKL